MRKHLKYLRKEKGMTLVELLAVLVILGIIAAIAVPMIGNVIENSRNDAKVNDALNIISGAKLAYANNDFPDEFDPNTISTEPLKYVVTTGQNPLEEYVTSNYDNDGFTVTFDGSTWYINGHVANSILTEDNISPESNGHSEKQLLDYLGATSN